MAVFESCSVLLDLKTLSFKEKEKLKAAVTENGGSVSFVVNKQCTLIVTSDVSKLSANRLRSIQRYGTPVVGADYVYGCLDRGALLPVDEFKLDTSPPVASSPPLPLSSLTPAPLSHQVAKTPISGPAKPADPVAGRTPRAETPQRSGPVLEKFRIYTETDSDRPSYPDDFQVAKYSIFEKTNSHTWCVLELQSVGGESGRRYRVVRKWKDDVEVEKEALVFPSTSEEAVDVYQTLRDKCQAASLQLRSSLPPQARGSAALQQLLLEENLNTGSVSQEVAVFVELLWIEALGQLSINLKVPIDKLSLNDVSRAEGLLLQTQKKLREEKDTEARSLLEEFYVLLQHHVCRTPDAKLISQKLDLCQLIRDVLNAREMSLRSPAPSCVGKYRALRCSIETVPPGSSEFQVVTAQLQDSKVKIQQVLRVARGMELQAFRSELGNIRTLLHSSNPSNFVGILSRGLLLPRAGVEHHGIERTDIGNLGSGIYFSDCVRTSLKYSRPSGTDGSRLLLVCDVALGSCQDVRKRDPTLTEAPEGHHSVRGVRRFRHTPSEFEDDEYVVYAPDQVKLRYVVQFSMEGEELREFCPAVDTSDAEPLRPHFDQVFSLEGDGVELVKNPLEDVKAGLLDSSGQRLPLQAVHVKCKLMDLLSQVIIFQKYTNTSSVPIEAKYVFPLDDSAAVCGFEAFINGKHVVGKVKEKEAARREYRQAVEKGHGAYLMDQDAPDVFTISVGNLPPGASVLIKVTFVSELIVRDGSILFSLPGSVAPWQESAALNQTTQVTVEKVCVTDEAASTREFTLDMSVEMPNKICSLQCITHKVKLKRTDCKAVLSLLPGQVMGAEGFQLSVSLSEVHLPRMWVEKHPDKDSQACMLVFYPDFDAGSGSASDEVVLLLDTSESMKGESLRAAQRIALQVLKTLGHSLRVNVVLFGTDHKEAFPTAQPLADARRAAESFIKTFSPVGGSTELWRPLRALSLLPPSRGTRNLLLLSDGHIQNPEFTLKLLRDDVQHSRLFTCGLSPTANRHMLRALAQAGGGAYEFFDTKTKHNWAEKVACQVKRVASPGCSSVSVKWQQFDAAAPAPVQAPGQLHALFNDCHTLVYGFVPHCTQATLLGNLSGQELNTMVSTSELQKTKGTFLHKLTARALIRDYEDGSLATDEAEHEGKKAELKSFIVELSREFSILSRFTSFVAVEERDSAGQPEEGFTDIPKLIAEEDVDLLPYIGWDIPQEAGSEEDEDEEDEEDEEGEEDEEDTGWRLDLELPMYKQEALILPFTSRRLRKQRIWPKDGVERIFDVCREVPIPQLIESSAVRLRRVPHMAKKRQPASPPPPPPAHPSLTRHSFSGFAPAGRRQSQGSPPTGRLPQPAARPPAYPSPYPKSRFICLAPSPDSAGFESLLQTAASPPYQYSASESVSAFLIPPPAPPPFLESGYIPACLLPSQGSPLFGSLLQEAASLPYQSSASQSFSASAFPAPPACIASGFGAAGLQQGHFSGLFGSLRQQTHAGEFSLVERDFSAAPPPPPPFLASEFVPPRRSLGRPARSRLGASAVQGGFSAPPPPPPAPPLAADARRLSDARPTSPRLAAFQSLTDHRGFSAPPPPPPAPPLAADAPQGSTPEPVIRFAGSRSRRAVGQDMSTRHYQSSSYAAIGQSETAPDAYLDMDMDMDLSFFYDSELNLDSFGDSVSPLVEEAHSMGPLLTTNSQLTSTGRSSFRAALTRSQRSPPVQEQDYLRPQSSLVSFKRKPTGPEELKLKWTKIFQMQNLEGYWELSTQLGQFMDVNVDLFANVFLKNKGIVSLGVRAHADILRLLATLLVLQLMREEEVEEGKLLRTLFRLDDSSEPRPKRWGEVKKAVEWVRWADRQYPCIYSRLEFGLSWQSSTRQLLGYEGRPPFSPLSGLDLRGGAAPLLVN